jgi:multiple sugar transport system substrate-binding protein
MVVGLTLLSMVGCNSGALVVETPTPTPLQDASQPTRLPTATMPLQDASRPLQDATRDGSRPLVIWLPPQFNPDDGSRAGAMLRRRLDEFIVAHPGVMVEVRLKAVEGQGGLSNMLETTAAVAPEGLPEIIALNRSDLESAFLKGLIIPYPQSENWLEETDWYAYTRQLSSVQGTMVGMPFAGDMLMLVYRPGRVGTAPETWEQVFNTGLPVATALADRRALLGLTLYLSTGGSLEDEEHRPVLQIDNLTRVLELFADGGERGAFPAALGQLVDDQAAWQYYLDNRSSMVVTLSSNFLSQLPADSTAIALPVLEGNRAVLADGWVLAMPFQGASRPLQDASRTSQNGDVERQRLTLELVQFLVDSKFLSEWSEAEGFIPARPSALAAWRNQSVQVLCSQLSLGAQVIPANDLLFSTGQVISEAILQVNRRQMDPQTAAQAAIERLAEPQR